MTVTPLVVPADTLLLASVKPMDVVPDPEASPEMVIVSFPVKTLHPAHSGGCNACAVVTAASVEAVAEMSAQAAAKCFVASNGLSAAQAGMHPFQQSQES